VRHQFPGFVPLASSRHQSGWRERVIEQATGNVPIVARWLRKGPLSAGPAGIELGWKLLDSGALSGAALLPRRITALI